MAAISLYCILPIFIHNNKTSEVTVAPITPLNTHDIILKKFALHTFSGFLLNSVTFQDLEIITLISYILETCVENLALLKFTLNHQTPLFCCCNCGPFWNLISWSRGSRADAILNGIIEVGFFFFSPACVSSGVCRRPALSSLRWKGESMLKACRKPSSLYCLIWRGGVRWAGRGNTSRCCCIPLESSFTAWGYWPHHVRFCARNASPHNA